jgi:hypothetical protein
VPGGTGVTHDPAAFPDAVYPPQARTLGHRPVYHVYVFPSRWSCCMAMVYSQMVVRAGFRLIPLLLLVILMGCEAVAPTGFSRDIDELLARGNSYASSLATRPSTQLTDEEVIALGYLERARLGVGSPFRTIAFLRRDVRLSESTRELVSYAILRQAIDGRIYQVDPTVLDATRLVGIRASVGERHLELIERTVSIAPTPRSGERAVRLGYMLAAVERTVDGNPEPVVSSVAAMVGDRRRAREDAVELLRRAGQLRTDPLELLEVWRRELRFGVEAPALGPVGANEEISEVVRGQQVTERLRALAQRLSAPALEGGSRSAPTFWRNSWITPEVAERLEELAAAHNYPAQAPVAVAVVINRAPFVGRPGISAAEKERRARFTEMAQNEERLVAGAARIRSEGAAAGPRLPLILLQSAVFMRGWNQEEPWFPGDPAPSGRDLETRFGIQVSFDPDVPESWRPYYRRMMGRAFGDMQRVLPTALTRGLVVHIGEIPQSSAALALHDPRTRTLTLPPSTGAGTIAHEIAHDLDWQLARRRYGRRGSYGTDLAVNQQTRDRIATSLAGLTASFLRDGDESKMAEHERRPAEVFARGTDWLVATLRASEGRTGGYLTSFQDASLAGYGTTRVPHLDGNAVSSLLLLLDQVAPVPAETRQWALDTYGPNRTLTAKELARAITSAPQDRLPYARLRALEETRNLALTSLTASSCRMASSTEARRLVAARRQIIETAVAAAARGIVVDGVRAAAAVHTAPLRRSDIDAFLLWRLDGGPEPADSSVLHLHLPADELTFHAAGILGTAPNADAGFDLNPERALCGGNPFASESVLDGGTAGLFSRPRPQQR